MAATVEKNRSQPREVAVLRRTRRFDSQVSTLLDALRACRDELRRASGNPAAPLPLLNPDDTGGTARLLGAGTPRQRALGQLVAAYTDTLRRLSPAGGNELTLPAFDALPAAEALATLTGLECTIRGQQIRTLQQLARPLGASRLPSRPVAVAAAETDVVAPGATYQATLQVVTSLSVPTTRMFCNGRPVPVGPDGAGQVRFRAPARLGPATWQASIRLHQNGRDTTFLATVAYRVARP